MVNFKIKENKVSLSLRPTEPRTPKFLYTLLVVEEVGVMSLTKTRELYTFRDSRNVHNRIN